MPVTVLICCLPDPEYLVHVSVVEDCYSIIQFTSYFSKKVMSVKYLWFYKVVSFVYICLTDDAEVILLGTGRTHIVRAHPFWRVLPPISEKRISEWFHNAALQKIWMRLRIRGLKQGCEDESGSGSNPDPWFSLQPPKENIQPFQKLNLLTFSMFVGNFCPRGSGSGLQIWSGYGSRDPHWIRIHNTGLKNSGLALCKKVPGSAVQQWFLHSCNN